MRTRTGYSLPPPQGSNKTCPEAESCCDLQWGLRQRAYESPSTGTSTWPSTPPAFRPQSDSASAKPFGLWLLPDSTWRSDGLSLQAAGMPKHGEGGEGWTDHRFEGAECMELRKGGRLCRTLLPTGTLRLVLSTSINFPERGPDAREGQPRAAERSPSERRELPRRRLSGEALACGCHATPRHATPRGSPGPELEGVFPLLSEG